MRCIRSVMPTILPPPPFKEPLIVGLIAHKIDRASKGVQHAAVHPLPAQPAEISEYPLRVLPTQLPGSGETQIPQILGQARPYSWQRL